MILDSFKLNGKVAIVTGASKGLGEGIAVGLAEAGADIAAVARGSMDAVQAAVEKAGRRCVQIKADLSSQDCIEPIIGQTVAALGRLDILVNNAGTIRRCPFVDFSEEDWDDVINVNQKSLFFLSQKAAHQMIKQGDGGKIIHIASMLSYQGGILVSSYNAAKSAVIGMTRIMANELAEHGIQVNGIAPGYMKTDNTEKLWTDPVRNRAILDRIPAGRWGTADDLKGAAVFLASAAADYMNGFTIAVDGGWLSR